MSSAAHYVRQPTKFDFDIDDLIREVHYRPAIWNKNCVGYTDRRLKARMWDEVCENIIENWKKLKILQQSTISSEIQKKWRNVKDAFKKEQKKILAGQDVGKKQYVHFKALSFLSNSELYISNRAVSVDESGDESDNTSVDHENTNTSCIRKRTLFQSQEGNESLVLVKHEKLNFNEENCTSEHRKQNAENNDNILEIEIDKSDFPEESANYARKKVRNKDEYSDRHFVEIKCDDWDNDLNSQVGLKRDQDEHVVKAHSDVKVYDEDIGFTEMMVPMLRKLNDDQKHYAKVEILNILHKAKRYQSSFSCHTQTEHVTLRDNKGTED